MMYDNAIETLFETLINGDRPGSRSLVRSWHDEGISTEDIVAEILWPTYELVDKLFREDQITTLSHHLATRLLRVLVDQEAATLLKTGENRAKGRTVFACSGPSEGDELGTQIAVDMLEANGFSVVFAGGGIPSDEILAQVHEFRPDVLLLYCAAPSDLPAIRAMIDTLHEIGACPEMQIVVGGGVFTRAEGLAEEIGADLWAVHPIELVESMVEDVAHRAPEDQRTVGRMRQRKAA